MYNKVGDTLVLDKVHHIALSVDIQVMVVQVVHDILARVQMQDQCTYFFLQAVYTMLYTS
jgi:hypothetical protein